MLEPFLPTVRLLVAKLPKPSIIVTSSPIEGDKGSVNVTTPEEVSTITWSPEVAV